MSQASQAEAPTIVIAGNPNTGKSTVFNQLTGGRARIGNYPGITVERSIGHTQLPGGRMVRVVDSPGTYSLAARSAEEQLAVEAVAGLPPMSTPAIAVVTVDATQLSRNLYLVLQIIELGIPVIVALNMVDALEEAGQEVRTEALTRALGVPVVPLVARRGRGLGDLVTAIVAGSRFPSTSVSFAATFTITCVSSGVVALSLLFILLSSCSVKQLSFFSVSRFCKASIFT